MENTTKITNIQGNGDWTNDHGTFYSFEYEFNDGTVLIASHKTQVSPFKVGDVATYVVKSENDHGKRGSVKRPDAQQPQNTSYQGKKNNNPAQVASFALSYAKDLAVAGVILHTKILEQATEFNAWLKNNS